MYYKYMSNILLIWIKFISFLVKLKDLCILHILQRYIANYLNLGFVSPFSRGDSVKAIKVIMVRHLIVLIDDEN